MSEWLELTRCNPLLGQVQTGIYGAVGTLGVDIEQRSGLFIVNLLACKNQIVALSEKVEATYGVALPGPGKTCMSAGVEFLWNGPEQWLVMAAERSSLYAELQQALVGLGVVAEQSHGRVVIRLAGARIRSLLEKLCAIDLHERVFQPGDCALTAMAHINIHLRQLDEQPRYEVQVFRSLARSLWEHLIEAAAEFGYQVK